MYFVAARFWILDFFGRVLDHNVLRDSLFAITPPPGRYPGLFFFADDVSLERFPVTLRKGVSLPMPIPPLQAIRQTNGLVLLQRTDGSGRYLRSVENDGVDFSATEARDWEHFFLLSEPMIRAYAILSQGEVSVIMDPDGVRQEPLRLVQGHAACIGEIVFSIVHHADALEAVASLGSGEEMALILHDRSGDERRFIVRRS